MNYYDVLMEGINDLVFVMRVKNNHTFNYEFINKAAMNETGLDKKILGKSIDQVFPEKIAKELNRQYKQVAVYSKMMQYEDTFESATGETYHAETTLTPMFNDENRCTHIVAVTKNITEEVEAKLKMKETVSILQENEQRFRIIAENSYDVIMLIDAQGKIIYISPSCQNVLGFSHKEYVGNLFSHKVFLEDRFKLERTLLTSIKEQKACKLKYRQAHKTKGWIWTELHGTPVYDKDGDFRHMVLLTMDITLKKRYEDKIKHFAYHDSLTGLPNRRLLNKKLVEEIKRKKANQDQLAVMMLDIDHFKLINDKYGHDIGDLVIEEFSKRLKNVIQSHDIIARLGGDEFVIVLTQINGVDEAIRVAEDIQEAMHPQWQINDNILHVTTSIGLTMSPVNGTTTKYTLLKHADLALYKAKKAGRSSYQFVEIPQDNNSP
ncbi:MAG TPA: diguanylate cyclase [Cerasibacillus sp.]|uniref:sensor domain-containing protein n=1 Tax=Cerasibacillus sp. TaxID=2498711 RepID=UPI002F41FC94